MPVRRAAVNGRTYAFDGLATLLARATPLRSGDRLAGVAAELLAASFADLISGRAARVSQDELGEASHVGKLDREDGRLDWTWSAARLSRRIRAYDPWPGTWCLDPGGEKRIKIFPVAGEGTCSGQRGEICENGAELHVCCSDGSLILGDVQPDGGRRMAALDWWRGRKERESSCLG